MNNVLLGYHRRDVRERLETLFEFRKRYFPPGVLQVAEMGRFNIPPGSSPAARSQLYYATMILLMSRPIQTVYVFAPRAPPDERDRLRKTYENYGFTVLETIPHVFGLPNGAHVMRSNRDGFVRRLVELQMERPGHLLPHQRSVVQAIKVEIEQNR